MRRPEREFQANRIAAVSHLNPLESYCTSKFQKVLAQLCEDASDRHCSLTTFSSYALRSFGIKLDRVEPAVKKI